MTNELNQDKWMRYEDDIIKYYYKYWKEWLDNPKRKPSGIAFTSGLGRDVANLMEDAMRVREVEILKMIDKIAEDFHCECSADEEGIELCKIHEFKDKIEKQIKNGSE